MDGSDPIEIARSVQDDEVRTVHLAMRPDGGARILQCSCGRLTELAYGERAICHLLALDAEGARRLIGMLGWGRGVADALTRFFSSGDASLADLLDICDRAGIERRFCSIGERAGTMARA